VRWRSLQQCHERLALYQRTLALLLSAPPFCILILQWKGSLCTQCGRLKLCMAMAQAQVQPCDTRNFEALPPPQFTAVAHSKRDAEHAAALQAVIQEHNQKPVNPESLIAIAVHSGGTQQA